MCPPHILSSYQSQPTHPDSACVLMSLGGQYGICRVVSLRSQPNNNFDLYCSLAQLRFTSLTSSRNPSRWAPQVKDVFL